MLNYTLPLTLHDFFAFSGVEAVEYGIARGIAERFRIRRYPRGTTTTITVAL